MSSTVKLRGRFTLFMITVRFQRKSQRGFLTSRREWSSLWVLWVEEQPSLAPDCLVCIVFKR